MIYKKNIILMISFFVAVSFYSAIQLSSGNLSFRQVLCIIFLVLSLISERKYLLYMIFFVLPLGNFFKFQNGLMLSSVLVLIYLCKAFISDLNTRESKHNPISLCILSYSFLISFLSSAIYMTPLRLQLVFYFHLLFIYFASRDESLISDENYHTAILFFTTGTVLVCLFTTIFPNISFMITEYEYRSEESLINAGFSSTWDFGRSITISISFLMVLLLNKKINFIFALGTLVYLIFFLTLSARFTMLIGLVFLGTATINYYLSNHKTNPIVVFCILIVAPIAIYFAIHAVYGFMVETRGYDASDNGRYELWNTFYTFLLQNIYVIFFGTGAGTIGDVAEKLNTDTAHNLFLEKTIEFGLMGSIVLLLFIISLYRKQTFSLKHNIRLIPLIAFLGTCLTQGTTGSLTFVLLLSSISLLSHNPHNQEENTIEHSV